MLEGVEKSLDEYIKAIDLKNRQSSDIKKVLQGAMKSYHTVVNENIELKKYIENFKQKYQQSHKQQQQEYLNRKGEYFRQKEPKKYKKVIYEEESDSEPEEEVDRNLKKQRKN